MKSIEDLGDTKTQTISVLAKIKTLLESRGYKMSDLIKLTLFVAADPKLGHMDFAGANEGFKQFFKTSRKPQHRRAFDLPGGGAGRSLLPDRDRRHCCEEERAGQEEVICGPVRAMPGLASVPA